MNTNLIELWPTPIWNTDIPFEVIDPSKIASECYQAKEEDPAGRQVSNIGGWQSKLLRVSDLNTFPNIQELMKVVNNTAMLVLTQFGINLDKVNPCESIWININYPNNFNTRHVHPGALLSGVYYAKADPMTGPIIFHMDEMLGFTLADVIAQKTPYTSTTYPLSTAAGQLKLFPSWVPHEVGENQSTEDRISIAFNFNKFSG